MDPEQAILSLGSPLPEMRELYSASRTGAKYVSHVQAGELLYLSGVVPIRNGKPLFQGQVGKEVSVEQGYEASRQAALCALTVIRYAMGSLNRVQQIVQMTGYVNSVAGFTDQSRVVNGATDLLVQVFGERGRHTRVSLSCAGLPANYCVELALVVQVDGKAVRPGARKEDLEPST